jgi:organic hydroperoxide reductase OsmC/OhrA
MATVRARRFEYGVTMDRDWEVSSDRGGQAIANDEAWTPEHLLLAGLCRCVMTSLAYHAKREDVTVTSSASASGTVTLREEDGRFAFVEIAVDAEAWIEPALPDDALRELLVKGEHDCFVGASLTVKPAYRWTVNGRPVT